MKQNTLRILNSCGVAIVVCGIGIYNIIHRNSHPESINNSIDYQLNIDYQAHPVASFIGSIIPGIIAGFAFYWLSGWRARRKQEKLKRVGGDKFYDEVARELQEKPLLTGLWTKAFAEMGGDDAKTRALYIKFRVAQLTEASHQQLEEDRRAKKWSDEQKQSAIEAAKRQGRTSSHRFIYLVLGLASALLTLIFGLCGLCAIYAVFNEEDNDSLVLEIVGGFFCLLIAFCFGLATKYCNKETK
jgi:hypothetical protein